EVRIGHVFNFTDKEYYFDQENPYELYGLSYQNSKLRDLTEFQEVSNVFSAQYKNNILGKFLFKIRHADYNYGYKRKLNLESGEIPNRLKGDIVSLGASYQKQISGFELSGDMMFNTIGDFDGNYIKAKAAYQFDKDNRVEAGLYTNSRQPNYNFLLFQSAYQNYNWYNNFKNEQKQQLYFKLKSEKLANIELDYTRIHNYTYFGLKNNTD